MVSSPYIVISKGYKYQVRMECVLENSGIHPDKDIDLPFMSLSTSGRFVLKPGFAYDGASGITWDTASTYRAAGFHDAGYQMICLGLLDPVWRRALDVLFGKTLVEDGMWTLRKNVWVRMVRNFGQSHTLKPKEWYYYPKLIEA